MDGRIKSKHPSFVKELGMRRPVTDSNLSMESYGIYVSAKARNIHCWIQCVAKRNRPLTFVEESESRLYLLRFHRKIKTIGNNWNTIVTIAILLLGAIPGQYFSCPK